MLKLLSWVQMFGLLVVFLGDKVFDLFGFRQIPRWYGSVQKNGMQLAIFIYLLLPNILSKYLITGAFEIILDDKTIFSKIETGRLPQFADLVTPLVEAGLKQVVRK
jgi:selT/selW/selH-like putative selenoprotein